MKTETVEKQEPVEQQPVIVEQVVRRVQVSAVNHVLGLRVSDKQIKPLTRTAEGYCDNEGNRFKSPFQLPKGVDIVILN